VCEIPNWLAHIHDRGLVESRPPLQVNFTRRLTAFYLRSGSKAGVDPTLSEAKRIMGTLSNKGEGPCLTCTRSFH
jgi:hypothetical protein